MTDVQVVEEKDSLPARIARLDENRQAVDDLELLTARYTRVGDTDKAEECASEYVKRVEDLVGTYKSIVRPRGRQPKESRAAFLNAANGDGFKNAVRHYLSVEEVEQKTGVTQEQVSKWTKRLQKPDDFQRAIIESAYRKWMGKRGQSDGRGASGTGDNEWYTPPEYVERARAVLGEIDLDPASSKLAQKTVRAAEYFTPEKNGLERQWFGRVWLNPPYAQPLIANFSDYMVSEWNSRRVTAAIVLTHNYTDTTWFQGLAKAASAICFKKGRIKFKDKHGNEASPTQGQAFFYFGADIGKFAEVFDDVGFVVTRFRQ